MKKTNKLPLGFSNRIGYSFWQAGKKGACQDWNRLKTLGGTAGDPYLDNFCELKGYNEMISTIQKKE
jgi:hypothetical protein